MAKLQYHQFSASKRRTNRALVGVLIMIGLLSILIFGGLLFVGISIYATPIAKKVQEQNTSAPASDESTAAPVEEKNSSVPGAPQKAFSPDENTTNNRKETRPFISGAGNEFHDPKNTGSNGSNNSAFAPSELDGNRRPGGGPSTPSLSGSGSSTAPVRPGGKPSSFAPSVPGIDGGNGVVRGRPEPGDNLPVQSTTPYFPLDRSITLERIVACRRAYQNPGSYREAVCGFSIPAPRTERQRPLSASDTKSQIKIGALKVLLYATGTEEDLAIYREATKSTYPELKFYGNYALLNWKQDEKDCIKQLFRADQWTRSRLDYYFRRMRVSTNFAEIVEKQFCDELKVKNKAFFDYAGDLALPSLRELCADDDPFVRARSVEQIGLKKQSFRPDLLLMVKRLKDTAEVPYYMGSSIGKRTVGEIAASSLGKMGIAAQIVAKDIEEILPDLDAKTRLKAEEALGKINR